MSLNRREMLRLGAMGAAGAILSSAASSSCSVGSRCRRRRCRIPDPYPAFQRPVAPSRPAGIDPQLFARAKAALDFHKIAPRDSIGIVDFSQPSNEPRFHVVDLASGTVESHRVAHGRGSDPDHSGFVERFSNDFGSYASSNGTYVTDDYYEGKYGLSMKVRGLDWSQLQRRAARDRHPQRLVRRGRHDPASRQARPLRRLLRDEPRRASMR